MTAIDETKQGLVEEIVNRLVQVAAILCSGAPIVERLEAMCEVTASILGCDRSSVMRWDDERYRGVCSFGLPDHLVPNFHSPELSDLLVALTEGVEDFVVVMHTEGDPISDQVVRSTGVEAAVICPMSDVNGTPVGILTAGFYKAPDEFDDVQIQILLGLAGLIRVALITDLDHEAGLKSLAKRRELRLELEQSEQESRRRISVEIHDDSMRKLAELDKSISELASVTQDQTLKESLEAIGDESRAAVTSLGDMFFSLFPQVTGQSSLAEALMSTLRSISIRAGWKIDLVDETTVSPSARAQGVLLRVARQALANADLHASAQTVLAELRTERGGTLLTIFDDGVGFIPDLVPTNRFGLLSMKERTESCGGTFVVMSELGVGTAISIWIPDF